MPQIELLTASGPSYDLAPPTLAERLLTQLADAIWPQHGVRRTLDLPCEAPQGFTAFRRADAPVQVPKGVAPPSCLGLSTLRASGSSQFSPEGLKRIQSLLPASEALLDVDIRQESHGYDGTKALGWWRTGNSGNMHRPPDQVRQVEVADLTQLNALRPGRTFTAYEFVKTERHMHRVSLVAHKAYDEATLARANNVRYLRIPMTDRSARPVDAAVDLFVERLLDVPETTWVHFHCLHGHGRTTLYMSMYDMLRNADRVGLDDIIARQHGLGGVDLSLKSAATKHFLKQFHAYSLECIAATQHRRQVPLWSLWCHAESEEGTLADFIDA